MPTRVIAKTKYDWATAWLLFLGGATHEEISEMCKIPEKTVKVYSGEHFWAQRRSGALKRANVAVRQSLSKRIEKARLEHTEYMLDELDSQKNHLGMLAVSPTPNKDEGEVSIGYKMNMIEQHDRIARKTLEMDNDNLMDPTQLGFAMLAQLSKGHQVVNGEGQDEPIEIEGRVIEPQEPLVNESQEEAQGGEEMEQNEDIQDHEGEPKNTSSATMPLLEDSDANAGILSSLNAHPQPKETLKNTPNPEPKGTNGAKPYKLPIRLKFK
jgi:hypothetical protein